MLRRFFQAFTHPAAGPIGFGLALVMCALLVATSISAARNEAALRARLIQLARDDARTGTLLHARLAACESAGPGAAGVDKVTNASVEARAKRLAGREPQGFDVCARMESADRAVLENLK